MDCLIATAGGVAPFSLRVFTALVGVFVSSLLVFLSTTRRWTVRRRWVALNDWARNNGFKWIDGENAAVPATLANAVQRSPSLCMGLTGGKLTLLQMETSGERESEPPRRWNLLVRGIDSQWPMTALRPTGGANSFIDLLSLSNFPTVSSSERFVLYGSTSTAAARLNRSSARALLPPDIGLLLIDEELILDFSARPFDDIEFGRMKALAEQLASHLRA